MSLKLTFSQYLDDNFLKNILENFLSKMAKLVEMYVIKEINNLWYYMIVTTIYDNTCDGIIGFDIDFKVE